jgi:serine/threonine-protein kinase
MMGTPSYMSPEQAMGEDLDGSTDIFSLGVVAFEMLSGKQPFPGNNVTSILYKLVHSDPIHPDDLEVLGLLPDKWHEVFSRVLAKSPQERYPTAAAFVQNLELCLGSWFGSLEGETVVLREPVKLPSAILDETVLATAPSSDETVLASMNLPTLPPSEGAEPAETIAAPAPDVERTLYAGPDAAPAGADKTVLAAPGGRPAMTVTIRKPRSVKHVLVPLGAAALLLVGLGAFLLSRPSAVEPQPEPGETPAPLPATGSLRIVTRPEGARVLVNGDDKGGSPLLLETLPLGTYRVQIEQSGYESEDLEAPITAEAPTASLDVALRPKQAPTAPAAPKPALFRIRSTPSGAQVSVDGKNVGITPIDRLTVAAGSRVVRVLREGYLPWEDTFRARAGRTETIDAILTERVATEPEPVPEPEPAEPEPPGIVEGSLVERGEPGVVNPKCVRCPAVPYPEAARRSRLQGAVELSFLIDENGGVSDIRVLSSGGQVFDDAVVETVTGWRYEPATKHGVRVKMRWVQRFRFQQGR